jgi:hypothetical protein
LQFSVFIFCFGDELSMLHFHIRFFSFLFWLLMHSTFRKLLQWIRVSHQSKYM